MVVPRTPSFIVEDSVHQEMLSRYGRYEGATRELSMAPMYYSDIPPAPRISAHRQPLSEISTDEQQASPSRSPSPPPGPPPPCSMMWSIKYVDRTPPRTPSPPPSPSPPRTPEPPRSPGWIPRPSQNRKVLPRRSSRSPSPGRPLSCWSALPRPALRPLSPVLSVWEDDEDFEPDLAALFSLPKPRELDPEFDLPSPPSESEGLDLERAPKLVLQELEPEDLEAELARQWPWYIAVQSAPSSLPMRTLPRGKRERPDDLHEDVENMEPYMKRRRLC
ncbi:hypothetical protein EDC01DRAFT_783742 [Geopyxis carbonaria]|nr:hypothetical protein EDC01DRAFT_783742 [Geopyxis carbonaria]